MSKKTYSKKEVIKLLTHERTRARDIAYSYMKEHLKEYEAKRKAGYDLAFIQRRIAEICRQLGNTISGSTGIDLPGETMEKRIIESLED